MPVINPALALTIDHASGRFFLALGAELPQARSF
jgi:hypothetical protein